MHEAAFAYDWRTRFGLPLTGLVTGEQSLVEAWLLTMELLRDPSSHVHAAVAGWAYPMSREALVLADLVDLTTAAHADPKHRKTIRPYPRPFDTGNNTSTPRRRVGRTTRPAAEVEAALAQRGHHR